MSGEKAENLKEGCRKDMESETRNSSNGATQPKIAECQPESPTGTKDLMERICEVENLKEALRRVKRNKGAAGVDGIRVEEIDEYLKRNWENIEGNLLIGKYKPSPVRRVEIPKPDGGIRKLGIPTVIDRVIQQAILQVIQEEFDKTFSEDSYGFRPGKSAKQAVIKSQGYINEGYGWVVDIDLEKFFDTVNHDRLMSAIAKRIEDKRLLKLIRAYLNAGVMENGVVIASKEGTPQGGNLSPLLSNIVLDELDKELEKRGHKFVRYADDCNIYVRSERAGIRVMVSITKFIEKKLKLKVNQKKSAVDKPSKRKFLGFSYTAEKKTRIKIAAKPIERFEAQIRELTRRNNGISIEKTVRNLMVYIRGWIGYFGCCQTLSILEKLDSWIRRRMRCLIWKKWKTFGNRARELMKSGVSENLAYATARNEGLWRVSRSRGLQIAFSVKTLRSLGVIPLTEFVKV